MFKSSLIAALLAFAAIPAYAQYYDRPMECWNPGAGHFEGVRPGEVQNDLDMNRCRPMAGGYYRGDNRGEVYRGQRYAGQECWNPGARHFEGVRPGEVQSDLDFSRCRPITQGGYIEPRVYNEPPRVYGNTDVARECWNPRAGHFEYVREGTYQSDLDFSRCRFR